MKEVDLEAVLGLKIGEEEIVAVSANAVAVRDKAKGVTGAEHYR